jgi:hypothetical protein
VKTKSFILGASILLSLYTCGPASDFSIRFDFQGPETDSNTVYVAWIEDEDGRNLQNLYVCNTLIFGGLTGTADPYWKRDKYPGSSVDGVTGASDDESPGFSVTRNLDIGSVRKFRVCFEIDRSWNSNDYFYDRPAFTYRSGTIDLDDLQARYDLGLYGWMSNDTTGTPYGQQPKVAGSIPGWAPWEFMTDVSRLAPVDDMVSALTAVVSAD